MAFETMIGWRYLYGGKRDRALLLLAAASAAVALGGLAMVLTSSGASPAGVITFVIGLLGTVIFTLLGFFSVFVSVSVFGVVFGVAALTIVLGVTEGFRQQFREKVLGVNAHVVVTAEEFRDYRDVMDTAADIDREVVAVQPFIYAPMLATRGKGEISGVLVKGVDPQRVTRVLDLGKHMWKGKVESLEQRIGDGELPPILLGKELARKLKADLGDEVTIVVPLSNLDLETFRATASAPRNRRFQITGIFHSGFDEYDRHLVYASIAEVQGLVRGGDLVTGIELKVADVERADDIAVRLGGQLGPRYQVQDWYRMNQSLFQALTLQKIVLVVVLTLIIVVAAFNMVSALFMMVTDKTREIAILKSMGSSSSSVARVFQVVGIAIGGVGTICGIAIGVATCWVVSTYGYHLDPKVYLIDRLPIEVQPVEVVLVAAITMVISVVATLFPALKAAALRPAEGLRYD
jgi:lipoprotein-releasing system permease protein